MFKRLRPQQEEIQVNYNPPADGSYPPRLVNLLDSKDGAPRQAIWFRDEERTNLIPDKFDMERRGSVCKLIPLNPASSDVLVNGQPLVLARPLTDGDFIQWQKLRAIFQVDPVKDRRLRMQTIPQALEGKTIKLSHKLKKWVVINEQGVSFDGGQDFVHWDEINFLAFQQGSDSSSHRFEIHTRRNDQLDTLKNKLGGVDTEEIENLMSWLWYSMPFDLCVNVLLGRASLLEYFPDAYHAAAYEKIYAPSLKNQRVLPADENFIFGIESWAKRLVRFAGTFLLLLPLVAILALAVALRSETDLPFGAKWLSAFIFLIPFLAGLGMFLIGILRLPDGIRWVRRFFREKRWQHRDDQII